MSTIVGTNIEVTNIKYDSDTTAMIVSSTGGGAGTVPQGLAKWWCTVIQVSNTIKDSFNISGTTDTGTGRTQYGYTNNMANDGYSVVGTSRDGGGYNDVMNVNCCTDSTYSSSQVELFHTNTNTDGTGNPNDTNGPLWAVAHGDLA